MHFLLFWPNWWAGGGKMLGCSCMQGLKKMDVDSGALGAWSWGKEFWGRLQSWALGGGNWWWLEGKENEKALEKGWQQANNRLTLSIALIGLAAAKKWPGMGRKGLEEQEWKPLEPGFSPLPRAFLGLGNQKREKGIPYLSCLPISEGLLIQCNWEVGSFKMWNIEEQAWLWTKDTLRSRGIQVGPREGFFKIWPLSKSALRETAQKVKRRWPGWWAGKHSCRMPQDSVQYTEFSLWNQKKVFT